VVENTNLIGALLELLGLLSGLKDLLAELSVVGHVPAVLMAWADLRRLELLLHSFELPAGLVLIRHRVVALDGHHWLLLSLDYLRGVLSHPRVVEVGINLLGILHELFK